MPKLELISFDDAFCRSRLEQFKQYASVPDDSRDALLASLLKAAVLKVQEFADVALSACNYRLTCEPTTSRIVRLYMGGEIQSVKGEDGSDVDFTPIPGGKALVFTKDPVIIIYTTEPTEGDQERLLPTVFRYATALYDGENPSVLNQILQEVF